MYPKHIVRGDPLPFFNALRYNKKYDLLGESIDLAKWPSAKNLLENDSGLKLVWSTETIEQPCDADWRKNFEFDTLCNKSQSDEELYYVFPFVEIILNRLDFSKLNDSQMLAKMREIAFDKKLELRIGAAFGENRTMPNVMKKYFLREHEKTIFWRQKVDDILKICKIAKLARDLILDYATYFFSPETYGFSIEQDLCTIRIPFQVPHQASNSYY